MMSTKVTSHPDHACCSPGYATPADAMQADREKLLYAIALYTGTGIEQPDKLATVDVDPNSQTYKASNSPSTHALYWG